MTDGQITLALTAHAERVGLLGLLAFVVVGGWCAVATAVLQGQVPARLYRMGALVTTRGNTTTIVAGGTWAASFVAVAEEPAPRPRAAQSDPTTDALLEQLWQLPAIADRDRRPPVTQQV